MRIGLLALTAALVVGCGTDTAGDDGALAPIARGSDVPETVTCGGEAFPGAGLKAPIGAERGDDPAAAALREFIRAPRGAEPVEADDWRVLNRSDDRVLFGHGEPPDMQTVEIEREDGRWGYARSSYGCDLRPVRDGLGAAQWRVDPAHPVAPETTRLNVLVTERECASGQAATGRIQDPDAFRDEERVVLTFYVTPRSGGQNCQGNPETPAVVELGEPLGDRELFDGSAVPPRDARKRPRP